MATRKTSTTSIPSADGVLAWLKRHGKQRNLDAMARYAIPSDNAVGVTVGELKAYAKTLGKSQALAEALWPSGIYEARILAAFVGESDKVTPRLMDAWAADFDNWAIVDTVCFHLFDRAPSAWKKVHSWSKAKPEYKKRAAFALLWGLSVHDKTAEEEAFLDCLPLIERASSDDRLYVKKAVDMALRAIGKKRSPRLRKAARELAERLRNSDHPSQIYIGKSTLKALTR